MCSEYQRLLDAYQKAVTGHGLAVGDLIKTGYGHRDFDSVWRACEKARLGSEQARLRLDVHVSEHGCADAKSMTAS